jgi:phosphate transport system protein
MTERSLDHDLHELKALLLTMAGEAERALEGAIRSLVERDSELAQQVIEGDALLDRREVEADHKAIELIVRHRPMARDLRLVLMATKIAPELERVADQAVEIARQALLLNKVPPLKPFITLPSMADAAGAMVRDAINSFVHEDSQQARRVIYRDDAVDAMHEQIFRELLTYMMEEPRTIPRALALLLIARSLERTGDHATNIAEQVVYLVEAEDIRHTKPVGEPQA